MPFLATRRNAYASAVSQAAQLKSLAQNEVTAMAAGNVSANEVRQILQYCIQVKATNTATAAISGIAAYATQQEGGAYDVATAWANMNSAIDAVINWIVTNIPQSGGFVVLEQWTANGVTVQSFTPAQTAGLRTVLNSLIATID